MNASESNEKTLEDLKGLIGKEFEAYRVEVERGVIWKLAEAVGDNNPFWCDEEKAKKSKYGGIIASPALCMSMMMYGYKPGVSLPMKRGLDAWHDFKFYLPIRIGDVIDVKSRLVDVYERQGRKRGKMIFFVFETILTNQRREKICTHRGSMLMY